MKAQAVKMGSYWKQRTMEHFTFSFLSLLPLLCYTSGAAVVPNTKTTKTDARREKLTRVRNHRVLKERNKTNQRALISEGRKENKVITIPVTTSTAVCAVILDFLSNQAKLFPRGSWEGKGQPPLS